MKQLKTLFYSLIVITIWVGMPIDGILAQEQNPPARIAVSPSMIEMKIGNRPVNGALKVINPGKDPIRAQVKLQDWNLDEQNNIRALPPDEQSLSMWMIVNPLQIDIPPGEYRTIRYSVRPRVKPEPGEHRTMIYIEQIPLKTDPSELRILFRVGVGVYGYVGKITRTAELNDIRVLTDSDPVKVEFDLGNTGNANIRMKGQYAIWNRDEFPGTENTEPIQNLRKSNRVLPPGVVSAEMLPAMPVLPETRRTLSVFLSAGLTHGDYVLDIHAEIGDNVDIDRAIPFVIPKP